LARELDKRIPIQGVAGDLGVAAVLTSRDVAAERRGPAAHDGRHHLKLAEAHVAGVVRGDLGAVEFQLDPAIESGSQRRLFGFTRHVPHDRLPSFAPTP
jgi:hypothetical protein